MSGKLDGKRVAFLFTDGVEQVELTEPLKAVTDEGAEAARSVRSITSTEATNSRSM